MSTFRSLLLLTVSFSVLGFTSTSNPVQGGPGPNKLYGPTLLATSSSTSYRLGTSAKDQMYIYTVELNQTAPFPTTVYIANITESAQPIEYVITIPANTLTATFEVVAVNPGSDLLVASNASRAAYLEVLVL
jgi:hypothetical protein